MSVEQLKAKSTGQLAELGKKSDAINRLKIELGEKTATIFALEARDKALRDQLRATEEEFAVKTSAMLEAQRVLADKEAELVRLVNQYDEKSALAEAQRVEIVALKEQVDALKTRLTDAGNDLRAVEDRRDAERVELKAATRELAEERGKVENLGRRVAELEHALVAQTTEAEVLGRRAQDLENRLAEQTRLFAESDVELRRTRDDLDTARRTEADLRAAIAELDARASSASQKLKAENAELSAALARMQEDRDRIARELADMKRETEETWANERVENALLRERINDVAAEVARLASALEGPNSTIDAILAAESARDRAVAAGAAPVTVHGEATLAEAGAGGNLADRIRALQAQAPRAGGDEPQTRN
jgi:chromosome segregation ATPase